MKNRLWLLVVGSLVLVACQPAADSTEIGVTVVAIASSTPGVSGVRQEIESFFSFITPESFDAELENDSVFIGDGTDEIFISLAIIGAGDDERTAEGLVDEIFGKFEGHEVTNPSNTAVGGLAGNRADFSGVLQGTVVSGNYVIIDLGGGVSFFAFGMGNVREETDSWESYGRLNFTQLLNSVEILFGNY